MYNWVMTVWSMSANSFVWFSLKCFVVMWVCYQIHIEIGIWRARRIANINRLIKR